MRWKTQSDGFVFSVGASSYPYTSSVNTAPKRYVAHTATFSRLATIRQVYNYLCNRLKIRPEDVRLWQFYDEVRLLNHFPAAVIWWLHGRCKLIPVVDNWKITWSMVRKYNCKSKDVTDLSVKAPFWWSNSPDSLTLCSFPLCFFRSHWDSFWWNSLDSCPVTMP